MSTMPTYHSHTRALSQAATCGVAGRGDHHGSSSARGDMWTSAGKVTVEMLAGCSKFSSKHDECVRAILDTAQSSRR